MKKYSLFFLTFLAFFFVFGKERLTYLEKAKANCIVSKQLNDNLSSSSKNSDSEFEIISNQLSNATQANNRTHSLVGYLIAGSIKIGGNISFTSGIKKGFNHFSHKTYLQHIYPSHNFW
ncbi:MAG TPA: hypothetical protein VGQ09_04865 [Chitinophagaceae bacterium]|jgi:hypothetical protein|nr:hypothetical protein [Chitinophagaceae bacterium]